MQDKLRISTYIKIFILFIVIVSCKNFSAYAAWNNNAVDYANKYGKTIQYSEGAFWFGYYENYYLAGAASSREAILGFNVTAREGTGNNLPSVFTAKLGSDKGFSLIDSRISNGKIYKIWKIEYNNIVRRLKFDYPTRSLVALSSSKEVDYIVFDFKSIESVINAGATEPAGSIDDYGKELTSPTSISSSGIYNSEITVKSENKPAPIAVELTEIGVSFSFRVPDTDIYWVRSVNNSQSRIVPVFGVEHNSYLVHPDSTEVYLYKVGNRSEYYSRSIKRSVSSTGEASLSNYSSKSSSIGDVYIGARYWKTSYDSKYHYIENYYDFKSGDSGEIYEVDVQSVFNGVPTGYIKTPLLIKMDGTPPVMTGVKDSDWKNYNTKIAIKANDFGEDNCGIDYIELAISGNVVGVVKSDSTENYNNNLELTLEYLNMREGVTTFLATAADKVGNRTAEYFTQYIDKTAPTVSINTTKEVWKNNSIKATIDAIDELSGLSKIEYKLEGATTKGWTEYDGEITISNSGKTTIYARAEDNVYNQSNPVSAEVWVDNVAPTGNFYTQSETYSRDININISSLYDELSGVKEVKISNNFNFDSAVNYSVLGKISESVKFTLDEKQAIEENYSKRTIYIRLYDNVNNYKSYEIQTTLVPIKPGVPEILLPSNTNPLYVDGESIKIKWEYNSGENEIKLSQSEAVIVIKNEDTDKTKTIKIDGETNEFELYDLEYGQYILSVKTSNIGGYYSDEATVRFRYNKFKEKGQVRTINIEAQNKIKYVSIFTDAEIPKGCSVEGKVYYKLKDNGIFDYSKYVTFGVDGLNNNKIVQLPDFASSIKVDLILKNTTSSINPFTSPILDNVIVYAK